MPANYVSCFVENSKQSTAIHSVLIIMEIVKYFAVFVGCLFLAANTFSSLLLALRCFFIAVVGSFICSMYINHYCKAKCVLMLCVPLAQSDISNLW